MLHDTIAAVSTPYGKGGIAVIRISGDETPAVLRGCFHTSGPDPVENPRRACFGSIVLNGETVDTCLVTFFANGASFTGEASAEISCQLLSQPPYWKQYSAQAHALPRQANLQGVLFCAASYPWIKHRLLDF